MNIVLFKKSAEEFTPTLHTYFSNPLTIASGLFASNHSCIEGEINSRNINFNCDEIIDASGMFLNQKNIITVELNFPNLKSAINMFSECLSLNYIECDFSSLSGKDVQYGDITASSTANMFNNCKQLETINCNFESLTNGNSLFNGLDKIKNFDCNLASLDTAINFCPSAKLTLESLKNINKRIKDHSSDKSNTHEIYLGLGCSQDTYEVEIEGISFKKIINAISEKGWTVAENYNGVDDITSLSTLELIYCKKELSNEISATHKNNENNYYILYKADNVINDKTNSWRIFSSIEEAEQSWGLEKLPEKEI